MGMDHSKVRVETQRLVIFLFKAPKEDGKDKYLEVLQEENIESVAIPVLSFHYINQDVLISSLVHCDKYSAIIFTSVRAVDTVVNAIKSTGATPPINVSSLQCFVVGHTTEEAAEQAGFKPEGGHTGNAEALSQFILENLIDATKPLLFPCSSIHRENLPNILINEGLEVFEVESYETCAHEDLTSTLESNLSSKGVPDFVVFFSPSGFHFVHGIKNDVPFSLEDTKILALGPATCQSIRDKGLTPHGTAEKPDPKSLLQLIKTELHFLDVYI